MSTYNPENPSKACMSLTGRMKTDTSSAWRSAWFRATVRRLGTALQLVQPDRRDVALSTRAGLLMIAFVTAAACGGGGSPMTPTAPTPPVSTPAQPPAPAANLVRSGSIGFLSCIDGQCEFLGQVMNIGNSCAVNISGETWIVSAEGQEVARSPRWTLPPTAVIRPGEAVNYIGRLPQVALNHLNGSYATSFAFESRSC